MKRLWLIHPLLWAAFPVLFLFAQNAEIINPTETVKPILMSFAGVAALTILLTLILRNLNKAALLSTTFIILFFSFGHVAGALPKIQKSLFGLSIGTEEIVAAFWVMLLITFAVVIIRSRGKLEKMTAITGQLGLILVAIQLVHGGYTFAARSAALPEMAELGDFDFQPEKRPDIYYIVMDAFGRSDVLQEIYNVDNSKFIDYLRDRGFFVADTSHSNYFRTVMSLASALNMNYLDQSTGFDPDKKDKKLLPKKLDENHVFKIFQKMGYTIVSFDKTGCTNTEQLPVDVRLSVSGGRSEFETILITTSALKLFMQEGKSEKSPHRRMVTSTLDKLGNITEIESPKFVFAHVLSPHRPFVFGPGGRLVPKDKYKRVNKGAGWVSRNLRNIYITGYADQVEYIGTVLEEVVDNILDKSPENPPIIIIQGDHGPRSGLDWIRPDNTNLKECISILNAIYLPGVDSIPLYHSISPINTFRVIFNTYFGTDFKILPDESRFTPSGYPYPYQLIIPDEDNYTYQQIPALDSLYDRRRYGPLLAQKFETLTTLDRMRLFEKKLIDRPLSDCYEHDGPLMTFDGGKLELADCRLKEAGTRKYKFKAIFIPHGLPPKNYTIQLVFRPWQREIVRETDKQRRNAPYTFTSSLHVGKMKDDMPTYVEYQIKVPFEPYTYSINILIPGQRPAKKLPVDNEEANSFDVGEAYRRIR